MAIINCLHGGCHSFIEVLKSEAYTLVFVSWSSSEVEKKIFKARLTPGKLFMSACPVGVDSTRNCLKTCHYNCAYTSLANNLRKSIEFRLICLGLSFTAWDLSKLFFYNGINEESVHTEPTRRPIVEHFIVCSFLMVVYLSLNNFMACTSCRRFSILSLKFKSIYSKTKIYLVLKQSQ